MGVRVQNVRRVGHPPGAAIYALSNLGSKAVKRRQTRNRSLKPATLPFYIA